MTFKNDLNLFLLSFGRQIFEMSIQNVTEKAKAFLLAKNIDFDESTILMALAEAKRMIPEPESVTETRKQLKIYLKAFEKQILKVKIENLIEWSTNYLKEKKLLSFAWENWFWGEMYLYIAEAKKNADSKDGWCELAKDKTEDDDILTKSDGMINAFTISTFIHIVTCSAPTSLFAGCGVSDVHLMYITIHPLPHILICLDHQPVKSTLIWALRASLESR